MREKAQEKAYLSGVGADTGCRCAGAGNVALVQGGAHHGVAAHAGAVSIALVGPGAEVAVVAGCTRSLHEFKSTRVQGCTSQ